MQTFEIIRKYIKEKTKKDVTLNTNLRELGIDSLDLLEFVIDLEKEMNVKIDDNELIKLTTIEDIVKSIESKK